MSQATTSYSSSKLMRMFKDHLNAVEALKRSYLLKKKQIEKLEKDSKLPI
jgi:hypothetical protein